MSWAGVGPGDTGNINSNIEYGPGETVYFGGMRGLSLDQGCRKEKKTYGQTHKHLYGLNVIYHHGLERYILSHNYQYVYAQIWYIHICGL